MSALPLLRDDGLVDQPLRPHQNKTITMLRAELLAGVRRIVVELATGAGKTRIAAEITKLSLAKGNRVAFTVPAISLIDQTVEAFEAQGIDHLGVIQGNHPRTHYGATTQICSVQTIARRVRPEADVVIVDECHLQFEAIKKWMRERPNTVFIGLSATPWARGMADNWDALVNPIGIQELIDQGFLSPFKVYAPSHPDLKNVRTRSGDFVEDDLAEVMGEGQLVADVVDTWIKRAENRPTLVFAVNRAHARKLQAQFAAAGVRMGYVDAYTDRDERQSLFDMVERGELAGLVNIQCLTTGVDADIRCVVLARPTKSEMLFVQMVGRGLRTAQGKRHLLILDHSDNHARMGFVTDITYPALLDGKDRTPATRAERGEPMPKECKSCGVLKPPKVHACPQCGFAPEKQSEIEAEEGELVEVKRKPKKKRYTMVQKTEWYWAIDAIRREKNRATGWTRHTYRKKFEVWPNNIGGRPHHIDNEVMREARNFVRFLDIAFAKSRAS